MSPPRGNDHDLAGFHLLLLVVEDEGRPPLLDHEHLRVGMAMQRGSGAGRGVDEDEGDARVAEVVSGEFAAMAVNVWPTEPWTRGGFDSVR